MNEATNEEAEALSRQAGESSKASNFEDAVTLYERALVVDSGRVNDWINKGLALWRLHRNPAAMEAYDQAIALDPNAALAWMNRANVMHDLKYPVGEVLSYYDRALAIDPQLASAWYNKGDELAWMGDYSGAIGCFEKARDLGMSDAARLIDKCREIVLGGLNEIAY